MLTITIIYFIRKFISSYKLKGRVARFSNTVRITKIGLLLILTLVLPAQSQPLTYSILRNNKCIGKLNVVRDSKNDSTIYLLQSRVEISMLFHFDINTYHRNVFFKNQLKEYRLVQKVNGSTKESRSAFWAGLEYIMQNGNSLDRKESKIIYYTVASMYYSEPKEINYVFSEFFQQFIVIGKLGAHKYLLNFPNGNKTTYTYGNGVCTEVVAETDWIEVRFKLIESGLLNNLITEK